MVDPLSDIVVLLRPRTVFTKGISGAGCWGVRYSDFGHPSFCIVIEGACRLAVDGEAVLALKAGDFVLLPTTPGFVLSGFEPVIPAPLDPNAAAQAGGEARHGRQEGPPDVRILGGYFIFDCENSEMLVSLLPRQVHVRGVDRLSALIKLLIDEASERRSGRDLVLGRLVEILLIEALRLTQAPDAPSGLLRGLGDTRLVEALRQIHADPARAWTVAELAREAALSRSAFFDRFNRTIGMPPMEYLLTWRMALAKDMLRNSKIDIADIADRVGYASASTFSTAFSRHVGQSPGRFSKRAVEKIAESVRTA